MNKVTVFLISLLMSSATFAQSNSGLDYNPDLPDYTPEGGGPGFDILYAPSEADDPAFRAAIEANIDGVVDYFDARTPTPSVDFLSQYECVFTWANFAYFDGVALGDNLATYASNGGTVVMGAFTTFDNGNTLGGAIRTDAYSPVANPSGGNAFLNSAYAGDGTTDIHAGVTSYDATFRDLVTLQGDGIQDGSYNDAGIAAAFNPNVGVVAANGAGGAPIDGNDQDHPLLVANACQFAGEPSDLARFLVTKDFDDDNTAEVEVTISCNTGLPLTQTTTISEGDPVNFVVGDFNQGELDCEITEVVPAGYTASYQGGSGDPAVSCVYLDQTGGQQSCIITNSLNEVTVDVTKVWIDDNPQFNPVNYAEAEWSCTGVAFGCEVEGGDCDSGFLEFLGSGNPSTDTDSFSVFPAWDGSTSCSVTEVILPDGGVEIDDSDCASISVAPGVGGSCTITNTRLYEGIPTLSQYGLAIMALLMLGLGMVGFRRFV